MKKLILSTSNENKIEEIRFLLEDLPIQVLSKKDIGLKDLEIIEDGKSLGENSEIKARELSKFTRHMVLADDSGLFVDALDGQPGVYSSRYAGQEENDKKNNEKLLWEMRAIGPENRGASFKTVLSLIGEDKRLIHIEGECQGKISLDIRGPEIFGYDPLFIPNGYDKTFAELDIKIKNQISHRAKALKKLKKLMKDLLIGEGYENFTGK